MKLLAAFAGIFIALTASLPAQAQSYDREQQRRFQQERQQLPPRDAGAPRQDERGAGRQSHPGQMTPEERRQLRRDIREHGREVYRDRPRRF